MNSSELKNKIAALAGLVAWRENQDKTILLAQSIAWHIQTVSDQANLMCILSRGVTPSARADIFATVGYNPEATARYSSLSGMIGNVITLTLCYQIWEHVCEALANGDTDPAEVLDVQHELIPADGWGPLLALYLSELYRDKI